MIISHEYRFIFIKTPKTAGTSMEIALSKFCGPRDVLTPLHPPEDEQLRQSLGYPGPQNTLIPLARCGPGDWLAMLRRHKRLHFFNHMKARYVRRYIGPEIWNSYYKFAIDRNPWDAALSLYYWNTRDASSPPSFSEYLAGDRRARKYSRFSYYGVHNAIIVDHIMRFEDLDAELEQLQKTLGLPEKPALPRTKSGTRRDRAHYSTLIGPQERDYIAQVCAKEIALLGYRFEPPHPLPLSRKAGGG